MSNRFFHGSGLLIGDNTVPGVQLPKELKELIPVIDSGKSIDYREVISHNFMEEVIDYFIARKKSVRTTIYNLTKHI